VPISVNVINVLPPLAGSTLTFCPIVLKTISVGLFAGIAGPTLLVNVAGALIAYTQVLFATILTLVVFKVFVPATFAAVDVTMV
jgi:hypothetical protein